MRRAGGWTADVPCAAELQMRCLMNVQSARYLIRTPRGGRVAAHGRRGSARALVGDSDS